MLFLRFVFCLAVGLVGLGMVLMRLIDTLFLDWDPAQEVRGLMRRRHLLVRRMFHRRGEELAAPPVELSTRLNPYGRPSRPELAYERTSLYERASMPAPAEPA